MPADFTPEEKQVIMESFRVSCQYLTDINISDLRLMSPDQFEQFALIVVKNYEEWKLIPF